MIYRNSILNSIKLTTFNGKAFESWKQQIQRYLFLIGIQKFIEQDIIPPSRTEEHVFLDQTTSSIIDSYISDDVKLLIKLDVPTSFLKWKALSDWYVTLNLTEIDELFRKWLLIGTNNIQIADGFHKFKFAEVIENQNRILLDENKIPG